MTNKEANGRPRTRKTEPTISTPRPKKQSKPALGSDQWHTGDRMNEPDPKTLHMLEQCRESAQKAIRNVIEHAQGDVDLDEAATFLRCGHAGKKAAVRDGITGLLLYIDPPDDPYDQIMLEILTGFLE